jgi:hypothetical protein
VTWKTFSTWPTMNGQIFFVSEGFCHIKIITSDKLWRILFAGNACVRVSVVINKSGDKSDGNTFGGVWGVKIIHTKIWITPWKPDFSDIFHSTFFLQIRLRCQRTVVRNVPPPHFIPPTCSKNFFLVSYLLTTIRRSHITQNLRMANEKEEKNSKENY